MNTSTLDLGLSTFKQVSKILNPLLKLHWRKGFDLINNFSWKERLVKYCSLSFCLDAKERKDQGWFYFSVHLSNNFSYENTLTLDIRPSTFDFWLSTFGFRLSTFKKVSKILNVLLKLHFDYHLSLNRKSQYRANRVISKFIFVLTQ